MGTRHVLAAGVVLVALAIVASNARGAAVTFNILANGAKEVTAGGVPNQGDPDGTAIGTLRLDSGTTGNTGSATFNLTLSMLDFPLAAHHIHPGAPTTTGPPLIDFGNPETLRTGNTLSGTVTGLSSSNMNNVLANPLGFYYNLHNGPFPGGAVRDQLPEPGSLALVGLGGLGLLARRRRRGA